MVFFRKRSQGVDNDASAFYNNWNEKKFNQIEQERCMLREVKDV
jgi:hypothetical protein